MTNNPAFDALGSASIGALLVIISIALSVRIKSMLVGESADPEIEQTISAQIQETPGIETILRLITAQLGPNVMLAAKVKMKQGMTLEASIRAINELEKSIKEKLPDVRWSFIEMDDRD
jgi:divalent metal cation (Fe/Co/Zn/Cd) transporter